MISIKDILHPENVYLELSAQGKEDAVEQVLQSFSADPRVKDLEAFKQAVFLRGAPVVEENNIGVCIAHGRTPAVSSLVFGAARLKEPVVCKAIKSPVRLFFVAGIPAAFNSEYLRVIGAVARICRDEETFQQILRVASPQDFVQLLEDFEQKL
ncbi:MAG: PTS sugar transporter subunit IIA [Chthoniobacterales bacterium]